MSWHEYLSFIYPRTSSRKVKWVGDTTAEQAISAKHILSGVVQEFLLRKLTPAAKSNSF
jgi:hypothetical protein